MKLRLTLDSDKGDSPRRSPRLTGWQLIAALSVLGVIVIVVLLITPAPEVVLAVLESLVRIL